MDNYTRSEMNHARIFAEKSKLSTQDFIAMRRDQDRKMVVSAVERALAGAFGVLSTGEQCAAALVLSQYRSAYGSVPQTARRCGLEWLRAIRDRFPNAEGLDLIPALEAEDAGAPFVNFEEEARGQIEASKARTMAKADVERLFSEATAYCAQRGLDRGAWRLAIFFESEAVGLSNGETPTGWRPGCIALDRENVAYLAAGGNYQDGAARWERLSPEP